MRSIFMVTVFCSFVIFSQAQTCATLVSQFKGTNKTVINADTCGNANCTFSNGMLISHRAMNVFLADKTGYLSGFEDLSYFTNYVTLNTLTGTLTINHNFQTAKWTDEPIKNFFSVGVKANVADAFNKSFVDKRFKNELGVTLNKTWLGKVKTSFTSPKNSGNTEVGKTNNKQAMDALRAAILHSLEQEINTRETAFKSAINAIDSAEEIPGQNVQAARALVLQNFYEDLQEAYQQKFATLQAEALTKTNNYRRITTQWTSVIAYVPLAFPTYEVAPSYTLPFARRHPYPFDVTLTHTHFWQGTRLGKLFVTLSGKVVLNNGVRSLALSSTNLIAYKNLGGTDTLHLAALKSDEAFIGAYKTFITPVLRARVVYFPGSSHVGVSFLVEKNFGNYNLLNGVLGIPVILINKQKKPAMNVEFQVSYFDMNHEIVADRKHGNRTSIGVGVGIPFSRLMY